MEYSIILDGYTIEKFRDSNKASSKFKQLKAMGLKPTCETKVVAVPKGAG